MSIIKDLWIEEYHRISCEAEDSGKSLTEDEIGFMAHQASVDRFAGMCDEAKDRAKYNN